MNPSNVRYTYLGCAHFLQLLGFLTFWTEVGPTASSLELEGDGQPATGPRFAAPAIKPSCTIA